MVSVDPPTDPGAIQHTTDARVRSDEQPKPKTMVHVRNAGDHLVQIGSHYHFFEANPVLGFDRLRAYGKRLAIPAGDRVHFSPNEVRTVTLVPYGGDERVRSFYGVVEGPLEDLTPETALERLEDRVIEPLAKPPKVTE